MHRPQLPPFGGLPIQRAVFLRFILLIFLVVQTTISITKSSIVSLEYNEHMRNLEGAYNRKLYQNYDGDYNNYEKSEIKRRLEGGGSNSGGNAYKRNYYQYYDGDYNEYNRNKYDGNYQTNQNGGNTVRRRRRHKVYSSLSDVWLCLACALGWTVWMLSSTRPEYAEMLRYQNESSKKVLGHVLQSSLGQDLDGTGIPTYNAVIDYVVQFSEHPVQVRKCFQTRHLLQEGFANIELLVLAEDPTMSVLLDDYLADVHDRRRHHPSSGASSFWTTLVTYLLGFVLIGTSLVGAIRAVKRLEPEYQQWGWASFGVGLVMLYPVASIIHSGATYCYRCLGPVSSRPGRIIHGNPGNTYPEGNTTDQSNPSRAGSSGIAVGGSSSNQFVEVFEDEILHDVDNFNANATLSVPSVSSQTQQPGGTPRTSNLSKTISASVAKALQIHRAHDDYRGHGDETNRAHNGIVKNDTTSDMSTGRSLGRYFYNNPQLQRVFSGDRVMCIATNRTPTYDDTDKNDNNTAGGGGGGHYNQNATNGQYSISLPDANSHSCSSVSSMSMQSNLPHHQESTGEVAADTGVSSYRMS